MGSADLMPQNLNRRIEVLFPILDKGIKKEIISTILPVHFQDSVKKREMQSDGTYIRNTISKEQESLNAQEWLIAHRGIWNENIWYDKSDNPEIC